MTMSPDQRLKLCTEAFNIAEISKDIRNPIEKKTVYHMALILDEIARCDVFRLLSISDSINQIVETRTNKEGI